MHRITPFLLVILAACGGDHAGPKTIVCTNVGCSSGFQVSAPHVALDKAQIQGSTLAVCRNGVCLTGSLASWTEQSLFEIRDPAQPASVRLGIVLSAGDAHFEILYDAGVAGRLPDGDLYEVTLTTAAGATPIQLHQTATYRI